jgi:RNA polymerase sigma factor (sigma-70 family)
MEKNWIKQIKKKGSEKAANELVSSYYQEIYRYVYRQTQDQEQSLDLTQEIFISMLQSLYQFDEKKASFRTWLYKIATYKVVDYFRSKHYRVQNLLETIQNMEVQSEEDFTFTLLQKEELRAIAGIVNRLETLHQQIFRLKLFGDYSFPEIAASLQIPESTVKTKYYRSLKYVRKEMKEAERNAG